MMVVLKDRATKEGYLNTLRNIRNILRPDYNIGRLTGSDKVEEGKNPIQRWTFFGVKEKYEVAVKGACATYKMTEPETNIGLATQKKTKEN